MWRSEGKTVELVLSFFLYLGSGEQAQVAAFCSKCLDLLSHMTLDSSLLIDTVNKQEEEPTVHFPSHLPDTFQFLLR